MISVLIAADHPVVRIGLKQMLGEIPDVACIGEAASGAEVQERVKARNYDIILLDISMPGNGMEILKDLKKLNPRQKVLMMSIYPEQQYAVRALKAGADGYLTKDSAPDELVNAIHKIVSGHKYVSPSLAEKLINELKPQSRPFHNDLSDREYQVLCLVAEGKSSTEIARAMGLSIKTVSTYRSRMLRKLSLDNTAEAVRYAVERGICL